LNANPDIAVRCRGLTKAYGTGPSSVVALRGIDLDVHRGELLMVVGPSGCGKTTLISIIGTILDQDGGQCVVLDRDVEKMNETERAHFRGTSIGFVFQLFNLLPALTLLDNVVVPLLINGASWAEGATRARASLEAVGLGARLSATPGQLSVGQQQRVAIARALVHDPQLVLCDEPTSSLDHETGLGMMRLLRDVARRSERALIVVTHDPRILAFADCIARMDDGRIVDVVSGPAREHAT
jgi:putative ABC transport system ATP-binding protein